MPLKFAEKFEIFETVFSKKPLLSHRMQKLTEISKVA
jgi:hypothetical protein